MRPLSVDSTKYPTLARFNPQRIEMSSAPARLRARRGDSPIGMAARLSLIAAGGGAWLLWSSSSLQGPSILPDDLDRRPVSSVEPLNEDENQSSLGLQRQRVAAAVPAKPIVEARQGEGRAKGQDPAFDLQPVQSTGWAGVAASLADLADKGQRPKFDFQLFQPVARAEPAAASVDPAQTKDAPAKTWRDIYQVKKAEYIKAHNVYTSEIAKELVKEAIAESKAQRVGR